MWTLYVLRCRDGSLYTGVTTDMVRRLKQHNAGTGGAYTRAKRPVRLFYREEHKNQSSALQREAELKAWPKPLKEELRMVRLSSMKKTAGIILAAVLLGGSPLGAAMGEQAEIPMQQGLKKATFGAGCFWGTEKIFSKVPGVVGTSVGYMGGSTKNPNYLQVCSHTTGHAEVVQMTYDPSKVSYEELLITFWEWHDPTTPNQQGPDVGSQYRSVIFFYDPHQEMAAKRSKQLLEKAAVYGKLIVTEIVPAGEYWLAEEYHQKYLVKNPDGYCSHVLRPISSKIREILKPLVPASK